MKDNRMDTKKAGERREGDKGMEGLDQGNCFNMEREGGRKGEMNDDRTGA
jgi:hypothetical protein